MNTREPVANAGTPVDAPALRSLHVALIGYGEVGGILGRALRAHSLAAIRAYDTLFDDPSRSDAIERRALDDGVAAAASAEAAVRDADLVICAVTAASTTLAAHAVAPSLREGAFYVDLNSASPQAKQQSADLVNAAGGRYVEMAVMTSVPPHGIAVPMLAALGFNVTTASERYGVASAIKMCRSIVVKGMEAIVVESYLTARHYGVEAPVLASLAETFPGLDWEKTGDYFFQRVAAHGRRRAEEMREAAVTVGEADLEPLMAAATAARQGWFAELIAARGQPGLQSAAWRDWADWIVGKVPVARNPE